MDAGDFAGKFLEVADHSASRRWHMRKSQLVRSRQF